ncbi:hypothetical protein SteCoe_19800 [Stentor coeruleus]|uniref:Uncharacterized protein n=1 Tax=Stentor coeruleus TaxID=5963 RepID=A0A1R2BT82_9CILI|nr:hypothetical protein SteCoe_19800 [Stentor coeruleus]
MEKLPHLPRSLTNIRKYASVSPSSIRILKQAVNSRDTSKLINLSSTVRNLNARPINEGLELSFQLASLRKNLDKYTIINYHKENRLRNLKSKLKELKDNEIVTEDEVKKENYYYKIMQEIKDVQLQELAELDTQRIYEFVYERMRNTKNCLEKKDIKLRKQLELVTHSAQTFSRLRKDTIDSVNQYKIVYKNAIKALNYEKSSLESELGRMANQSKLKKAMIAKTEEHNKHRLEIVEQTMIDERSAHLEELRNGVLIYKMYEKFLSRKLVYEKNTFTRLDEAFQQVRIKTGLYNIEEVIEKFLTQEANYKVLIDNLHKKEIECLEYKEKLSKMQDKVNMLNDEKIEKKHEPEIVKKSLNKVLRVKEKLVDIENLYLKLHIWIDNYIKKAHGNNVAETGEKMNLQGKFVRLKNLVKMMLARVDEANTNNIYIDSLRRLSLDKLKVFYVQDDTRKLSENKAIGMTSR